MNNHIKNLARIALGLAVLLNAPVWGQGAAVDSFENFIIRPATPYTDSTSVYRLTFNLDPLVYEKLHKARLKFDFPEGFGLDSVDSVSFVSGPLELLYRVDKFTIEGQSVEIRLKKMNNGGGGDDNDDGNGDDDDDDEDDDDGGGWNRSLALQRVVMEVGLFRVFNPQRAGQYQITGTAFRKNKIIAGPSKSEWFEIKGQSPWPMADILIVSTDLIAPNSPKVNTWQEFPMQVLVTNVSNVTAHNFNVKLYSYGESTIDSQKFIDVMEPGDTSSLLFNVTAASEPDTELFVAVILSDNTVSEFDSFDNSATAIIQRPASLKLNSSVADGATINLPDDGPFAVTFELVNLGDASVSPGRYVLTILSNEINSDPLVRTGEIIVGHPVLYEYRSTQSGRAVLVNFTIDQSPIDSNTLQLAPIIDKTIEFTLIEKSVFPDGLENCFIVENNPFNPLDGPVKFRYCLENDAEVDFRIFTIIGEEVYSRSFYAGGTGGTSGQNEIQWDGRNHGNDIVLNGVYIAKLLNKTSNETASLKLAVLK